MHIILIFIGLLFVWAIYQQLGNKKFIILVIGIPTLFFLCLGIYGYLEKKENEKIYRARAPSLEFVFQDCTGAWRWKENNNLLHAPGKNNYFAQFDPPNNIAAVCTNIDSKIARDVAECKDHVGKPWCEARFLMAW